MAQVLSGKTMSEELTREQAARVAQMKEEGIHPGLAV